MAQPKADDSAASPSMASVWRAAMQNFQQAQAEELNYVRTTWMPAYHAAQAGGPEIQDAIDTRMEELKDVRCAAEEILIETPAPSLSAVIWKMEYAHGRWSDFAGWPDDWWNAVMNDLHHHAAGGVT